MKTRSIIGGIFFILFLRASPDAGATDLDVKAVKERIEAMENSVVEPVHNRQVHSFLRNYFIFHREKAAEIIGQSVLYFPLFEEVLAEQGLPQDLKYLAVAESALNPDAVSHAGAVGLWQFMEFTGTHFGLEINDQVDERRAPYRSTLAAANFLAVLYERFGDWELALAAYNAGSGRVSRAIKRSRSKNFWKLRRFLPRETRNYVPSFIAAAYLLEHYDAHDIQPAFPSLDIQLTEATNIYHSISFGEIARITQVPLDVLKTLNPGYLKGFIPAHPNGRVLVLPRRFMPAFQDYLAAERPDLNQYQSMQSTTVNITLPPNETRASYRKVRHLVGEGETVTSIARLYQLSEHQVRVWNKLKAAQVIQTGDELILYVPKSFKRFKPFKNMEAVSYLPVLHPLPVQQHETGLPPMPLDGFGFKYVALKRPVKLRKLAKRYPGLSAKDLSRLNRCPRNTLFPAGSIVILGCN